MKQISSLLTSFFGVIACALPVFLVSNDAPAAVRCTASCQSDVTVDTSVSPCTYTWVGAEFQVDAGMPASGTAPITLTWNLVGASTAYWGADGVLLLDPINDPGQDLNNNLVSGKQYSWDAIHLRPVLFKVQLNIYNGTEQCQKKPDTAAHLINLQ